MARRIAACDEVTLHIFYGKLAAQSVLGKDLADDTHLAQFFRADVA